MLMFSVLRAIAVLAICRRTEALQFATFQVASPKRIVNGSLVFHPGKTFPFHALPTSSADSDTWLGCGASIISPTFGMSAAHCFGGGLNPCSGPARLALWLGDVYLADTFSISPRPNGRSFRVEADVICHPQFDGVCSHGHDVVLLRLASALPDWVKPVPLNLNADTSEGVGELTTDIGYGIAESKLQPMVIDDYSNSHTLRKVELFVLPDASPSCSRVYAGGYGCSDEYSEGEATNIDQQICAGATDDPQRDTCSGDSGSPMLNSEGVQIGIVSYGGGPGEKLAGPGRICGDPRYPGVYSRVSAFKDFIESHVHDLT